MDVDYEDRNQELDEANAEAGAEFYKGVEAAHNDILKWIQVNPLATLETLRKYLTDKKIS